MDTPTFQSLSSRIRGSGAVFHDREKHRHSLEWPNVNLEDRELEISA